MVKKPSAVIFLLPFDAWKHQDKFCIKKEHSGILAKQDNTLYKR